MHLDLQPKCAIITLTDRLKYPEYGVIVYILKKSSLIIIFKVWRSHGI